ncbi:hypothetical protein J6590_068601 [Homalodisca vitripennis]|nr:hypothetical protein J6590_068601 [Homalodisca vitripennis]
MASAAQGNLVSTLEPVSKVPRHSKCKGLVHHTARHYPAYGRHWGKFGSLALLPSNSACKTDAADSHLRIDGPYSVEDNWGDSTQSSSREGRRLAEDRLNVTCRSAEKRPQNVIGFPCPDAERRGDGTLCNSGKIELHKTGVSERGWRIRSLGRANRLPGYYRTRVKKEVLVWYDLRHHDTSREGGRKRMRVTAPLTPNENRSRYIILDKNAFSVNKIQHK